MEFTVQLPSDLIARRRIQNRIAQRKFRLKKQQQAHPDRTATNFPATSPTPSLLPDGEPHTCRPQTTFWNPPTPCGGCQRSPPMPPAATAPITPQLDLSPPLSLDEDGALDLEISQWLHSGTSSSISPSLDLPCIPSSLDSPVGSMFTSSGLVDARPPPSSTGPSRWPITAGHDRPADGLIPSTLEGQSWLGTMHIAAQKGHVRIVRILLQRGNMDPNSTDSNGRTPLVHAAIRDHEPVVRLLLAHGAHMRRLDGRERSVVHWAVLYRRLEVLRTLLEHWMEHEQALFNINAYDNEGWTPLHLAAHQGFEAGVELLLQCGADTNAMAKGKNETGDENLFDVEQLDM